MTILGGTPDCQTPPKLGHGFMSDIVWAAKRQDEELDELSRDDDSEDNFENVTGGYR